MRFVKEAALKMSAICIVSTIAIGAIMCAPQPASSSPSSQASSQPSAKSAATGSSGASKSASLATPATQLSSAASVASSSPSFASLKSSSNARDELDTFDGKNPFADDSLWQIPVHLVRDLNSAEPGSDAMANSASELRDSEEDDAQANLPAQSSSASPTIISASTDLKTAAGYHYPTSHGHHGYGGGHDAGHHYGGGDHYGGGHHGADHYGGGHHGADHYGGKYFQYASVPYPHAWEFGYRRGNPYHTIERYEHGKGPHFQTKVKWSDKHGGYGVHVWDYNHDDHHSHHYGGHQGSHGPSHYEGHHGYGHH